MSNIKIGKVAGGQPLDESLITHGAAGVIEFIAGWLETQVTTATESKDTSAQARSFILAESLRAGLKAINTEMTLAEAQAQSRYRANPHFCPNCKTDNISTAGEIEANDDSGVQQPAKCLECRYRWIDVYEVKEFIAEDE